MSQAIPRGFHNWSPGTQRLAIQTPLHPVQYSSFEGVSPPFGSTLISDFGTYSIKTSAAGKKHGKDREKDTPDPEEEDGDSAGTGEERALAHNFARNSFVIELTGLRFKIRISLRYNRMVATGT